jgi:hypothetical protein
LCSVPDALLLSSHLADYFDHLAFLRDLILRWFPHGSRPNSDRQTETAAIAEAWRGLAVRAHLGIDELFGRLTGAARELACERTHFVADLLLRAAAGDSPCIDAFGAVKIPSWVDRRREARSRHGFHAFLQVDGGLQRVGVLDANEDGIGVLGIRGVAPGSRVGLMIKPGHSIDGTIAWVSGARAGIELDAPLPAECQLMTQLL